MSYVNLAAAYRDGGLEGLRRWNVQGPVSDLAAYRDVIGTPPDSTYFIHNDA